MGGYVVELDGIFASAGVRRGELLSHRDIGENL